MVKATKILFYVFLGVYVVLLLLNPQFAPIEEPRFFDSLQIGKYYPFEIHFEDARFNPLQSQEYNLVAMVLPATPFSYYIFNALQLLVFFLIFSRVLRWSTKNTKLIYLTLLLFLLSPGLNNVWFRLVVPERGVVFFVVLFIYFYLYYLKQNQEYSNNKSTLMIIWINLLANLAIYYKEPVFLAIGVFTLLHLIISWKKSSFKVKILDILLLIGCLIFILVYFFVIYLNSGANNYAEVVASSSSIGVIRNILAYVFIDPILLFCLVPLAGWRFYRVLIKKRTPHPVYDAMLGAAIVYMAAIFKLNLQSSYYLLPVYIFAIPALLLFMTETDEKLMARRWWQVALGIAIFLQVTSAVPLGLETLSEYKYIPINANLTMDFLVKDIKSKHPDRRINIFLDAIDRNSNGYHYSDFGQYLKYKGLTIQEFDLKSDLPSDNQSEWNPDPNSPYSVFQSEAVAKLSRGDYLIITPYSYKEVTDSYLKNMERDYKLLFRTHSRWAIPNIGLERAIKYLLSKTLPEETREKMFRQGGKLFKPIVDYYVFVRK